MSNDELKDLIEKLKILNIHAERIRRGVEAIQTTQIPKHKEEETKKNTPH